MELFDQLSFSFSKNLTKSYSTSFSLGIHMLDRKFHRAIYSIYAFVRTADEIVDTFHEYNKEELLKKFSTDTFAAIKEGISVNPILNSFQLTVRQYSIDTEMITSFLNSMEMDLSLKKCTENNYTEYIYGSAEVVGLMCLKVFCNGDDEKYKSLVEPARQLGSAFQKINFLRDLKSDYSERGRVYFPQVSFEDFTDEQKRIIENDIESEFKSAWKGIIHLPSGSKLGVMVAYVYYYALFKKIKHIPAVKIKEERIRISNFQKLTLLIKTWFQYKLKMS